MKILNLMLFAAACIVLLLLAWQADPSASAEVKQPNPMKVNEQQFARMQQSEPPHLAYK
ncbi:hypothetical protein [Gordoniibacillus kamchatkensis]|uniref:hypothetical protein n=1 Tax=Gordoniibacillus kamchatkensis TaxID=1590651 RepID=UPI000AC545E1|nr:hypothetical protein [Paenibacillus sp. VKM B-2647]